VISLNNYNLIQRDVILLTKEYYFPFVHFLRFKLCKTRKADKAVQDHLIDLSKQGKRPDNKSCKTRPIHPPFQRARNLQRRSTSRRKYWSIGPSQSANPKSLGTTSRRRITVTPT
jgi:hypothetical protein